MRATRRVHRPRLTASDRWPAISRVRRAAFGVAIAAAAIGTAGCAGFTTDPTLTLGLDNGTDRPVLVYVNDEWVGTFPVGADRDDIATGAHGGPPWLVEARTDAGVVLATFDAASDAALPTGIEADTACGNLALWAGESRPAELEVSSGAIPCE